MSFLEKLSQHRLIPLFYHNDIEVCKRVIDAVINSNLPILEFTNRGSKAIQNFEYLINYVGTKSNFLLGMGSVKNDEEAKIFIKLGAKFIISPFLDKSKNSTVNFACGSRLFFLPMMVNTLKE